MQTRRSWHAPASPTSSNPTTRPDRHSCRSAERWKRTASSATTPARPRPTNSNRSPNCSTHTEPAARACAWMPDSNAGAPAPHLRTPSQTSSSCPHSGEGSSTRETGTGPRGLRPSAWPHHSPSGTAAPATWPSCAIPPGSPRSSDPATPPNTDAPSPRNWSTGYGHAGSASCPGERMASTHRPTKRRSPKIHSPTPARANPRYLPRLLSWQGG